MLCRPATAQRCIRSFTGTILFMPCNYGDKVAVVDSHLNKGIRDVKTALQAYDCAPDHALNLCSYYGLVLISLTGLWTLWGWTQFLVGRQYDETPENTTTSLSVPCFAKSFAKDDGLVVNEHVLQYLQVQNPASTDFRLVRRFEYDFVGLLRVMMLHVQCNQGKWHLIEVYKVTHPVLRTISTVVFAVTGIWAQMLGRFLTRFVRSAPTTTTTTTATNQHDKSE